MFTEIAYLPKSSKFAKYKNLRFSNACNFLTLHPIGLKFFSVYLMWTFSTIFILCMGTLYRLLLAKNQDIKFLRLFAKMTGKGGRGGSIFS